MAGLPPAPARARRSDFQRTRRKIIDAARRLLADHGPESLTVSAVAHAAEINRTTAYQHFRTREELVRGVTAELIAEVRTLIGESRVLDRIDYLAGYFLDHPEIARLSLYLLLSENPFPREAWEPYFDEMRRHEAAGTIQDGVDFEMLAQVLLSVGILWPIYARVECADEADARARTTRFVRELKRLLVYGLFKPESWPEIVASLGPGPPPPEPRPQRSRA